MVRVGISVEGTTEEKFIKQVLAPYFSVKNIYLTAISLGGDVNVDKVSTELKKLANNFDHVTTFYDFYGFKQVDADETKASLEDKILARVHDNIKTKLIPFVQNYEFEGLLFSDPESMGLVLKSNKVTEWAQDILDQFGGDPERINNSRQTAPSKRLIAHTDYRKTTHGPKIAKEMGIDKIREMCAGFNAWLTEIEALEQ
ncbi:hypothetical protein A9Q98_14630 [Thalassotalea sp. 42_200_T64]|nr:hypothetical protein A9Q98_14630 [Thalassotalea sp. 42_200_T64]